MTELLLRLVCAYKSLRDRGQFGPRELYVDFVRITAPSPQCCGCPYTETMAIIQGVVETCPAQCRTDTALYALSFAIRQPFPVALTMSAA